MSITLNTPAVAVVGKGLARHIAVNSLETSCGRSWSELVEGDSTDLTTVTCKRCPAAYEKAVKWNRKISYMANRDAELDALTYGAGVEATEWRSEHYDNVKAENDRIARAYANLRRQKSQPKRTTRAQRKAERKAMASQR